MEKQLRLFLALAIILSMLVQVLAPVIVLVSASGSDDNQRVTPPEGNTTRPPIAPPLPGENTTLPPLVKNQSKPRPKIVVKPAAPHIDYKKLLEALRKASQGTTASSSREPSQLGEALLRLVEPKKPDFSKETRISVDRGEAYRIVLPTGDTVYVTKPVNSKEWRIAFSRISHKEGYQIVKIDGKTYIIPLGIDLSKFSLDLFNLDLLKKYQIDLGIKKLPLIVEVVKTINVREESKLEKVLPVVKDVPYIPLKIINSIALHVPFDKLREAFRELTSSPDVVRVYLDRIVWVQTARIVPSGNVSPEIYKSVPYIGVPSLWSMGYNGSGIIIAVLDTGIDFTHPDFYIGNSSKIIKAASFVDYDFNGTPDEPVQDLHGHGTHVAGIAAGTGGYLENVKGVAPGALLMVGKVLSNEGWGYDSWIIAGIEWAIENGANIISMSLGGPASSNYDPLAKAVDEAYKAGVLVVVAAGNEGPGYFTIASPGVAEGALTVGAIDTRPSPPEPAWFTSWGPAVNGTLKPDVVAPGVLIASAMAANTTMGIPVSLKHVTASGTSMATPHVSGYAAIVLQALNETGVLEAAENTLGITTSRLLKDVIVSTATDIWDYPWVTGAGAINATKLGQLLSNKTLIIVDPARSELGLDKTMLTLRIFNPWPRSINLTVVPVLEPYPETEITANLTEVVTGVPEYIELSPNSTITLNITVNVSALPRPGTHVLRLFFLENSTGTTLAQAMVGINTWRPLRAEPHTNATIIVTYYGEPVYLGIEDITIPGYYDLDTKVFWDHYPRIALGEGNVTIGPLYENAVYPVTIRTWIEDKAVIINLALVTPRDPANMVIKIDLASYRQITIGSPSDKLASLLFYYTTVLSINGTPVYISYNDYYYDLAPWYSYNNSSNYLNATLIVGASIVGANATTVSLDIVESLLDAKLQDVKDVIIETAGYYAFNATSSMYGFYRYYRGLPEDSFILLEPVNINYTILHVHSVISKHPAWDYSGLAYWSLPAWLALWSWTEGPTGTVTPYLIDTNVDLCCTSADDYVLLDYADIYAMDFFFYEVSDNVWLLAPLHMPRAATMWTLLYAHPGLDDYNYTGSFLDVHVYRSTIFGWFYMWPSTSTPPLTLNVTYNNEYTVTLESSSVQAGLEGPGSWYAHKAVPYPMMNVSLLFNLTELQDKLSFLSSETRMAMDVWGNVSYNELGTPSYIYIGNGYGQGVRDIIPLAGYNMLMNMIDENSTAYFLMVFNEPYPNGKLLTDSVTIALKSPNGTLVELPVLAWYNLTELIGYSTPLPVAFIAINASVVPKGVYGLHIEGVYEVPRPGYVAKARFIIDVAPAFYIGVAPGEALVAGLPAAGRVTVGPPGSGADFTSIAEAVASALPGTTIEVLPGTYNEEMIVVDKPVKIIGVAGENGELPVVEAPQGYPVFIVTATGAKIENLALSHASSVTASVPQGFTLVPGEALVPPAAIIVAYGGLEASNISVEGYPRGITAYEAFIAVEGLNVSLDSVYSAGGRIVYAADPTPVYIYKASRVLLREIYADSYALPLIFETPWSLVDLEHVYVNGEEVSILASDEPIVLENETNSTPTIIVAPQVLIRDTNFTGIMEVVADKLIVEDSSYQVPALYISTSILVLSNVSFVNTTTKILVYASNVSISNVDAAAPYEYEPSGLVLRGARFLEIRDTSVNELQVDAEPAAVVSITNSSFGYSYTAAVLVVLRDAAKLSFVNNTIQHSLYGVYVVPLYQEAAPTIIIEDNEFLDVIIPVYIAGKIPQWSYYSYYYSYPFRVGNEGGLRRLRGFIEAIPPTHSIQAYLTVFGDIYSRGYLPLAYIVFNSIYNSSRAMVIESPSLLVAVGNRVEANTTGIEGIVAGVVLYNDITAPKALNFTLSYGLVSYNNLRGNVTYVSSYWVDSRYNYIEGTISIEKTSEEEYYGEVTVTPSYPTPIELPETRKPIAPILVLGGESGTLGYYNTDSILEVGKREQAYIVFFNPLLEAVEFSYSVARLGALELEGDTVSTESIKLGPLSSYPDSYVAELILEAYSPGTGAVVATIAPSGEEPYRVEMLLGIVKPKMKIEVDAPSTVSRGEVFNITISIYSELEANTSATLSLYSWDDGVVDLDSSTYYAETSRAIGIVLQPGWNNITVNARGFSSGLVAVTAVVEIGALEEENTTSIRVLPNPSLAPSAELDYYPSVMEVGDYDYIEASFWNITLPTRIYVEAWSENGRLLVYANYTTLAYSDGDYTSVILYAADVGNDTVHIRLVDVDDNTTIAEFSIDVNVAPAPLWGYLVVSGALSLSSPNAVANITYPATTFQADFYTYLTPKTEQMSIDALSNMLSVPWGCVEQTTSPLLAAIAFYNYVDSRGLWSNITISPDEVVEDYIKPGVARLLEVHASHCASATTSCTLGWYPGSSIDLFFTPYGLLGLLRALEFSKQHGISVYSNETLLNETIEKLVRGLLEAQGSNGAWSYSSSDTNAPYYTALAAYALSEAYRLGVGPYNESLYEITLALGRARDYLETVLGNAMSKRATGMVVPVLYAIVKMNTSAGIPVNTTLLAEAVNYLNETASKPSPGIAYWWGYWPHYSISEFLYLTTAYAAVALDGAYAVLSGINSSEASLAKELRDSAVTFLVSSPEWLKGYNTFESAAVLRAINELGVSIFFSEAGTYIVYSIYAGNYPSNATLVFQANVSSQADYFACYFSNLAEVTESSYWCYVHPPTTLASINNITMGDWLAYGKNLTIVLELHGNATVGWFADTIYWYYPVPSQQPGQASIGEHLMPGKKVYLVTGEKMVLLEPKQAGGEEESGATETKALADLIEVEKEVTPPVALPGDKVRVKLTLRAKDTSLSYVIVSDPIPEGFSLVNDSIVFSRSGIASVDWNYYENTSGRELGFAITLLDQEGITIEYELVVPSNTTIGTTVTFDQAEVRLFYTPSQESPDKTYSNKPSITIGLIPSYSLRSLVEGEVATVSNNTLIDWYSVMNVTVVLPSPANTNLTLAARIEYNNSVVCSAETSIEGSIASLYFMPAENISKNLLGKEVTLVLEIRGADNNTLWSIQLKLRYPESVTMADVTNAIKNVKYLTTMKLLHPDKYSFVDKKLTDFIRAVKALATIALIT